MLDSPGYVAGRIPSAGRRFVVDSSEIITAVDPDYDDAFAPLLACAQRSAIRILGPGPDAEDVAQETLARAYIRWGEVGGTSWSNAWVARVSRNLAIDVLRGRRYADAVDLEVAETVDDLAAAVNRVEAQRALSVLSGREREVLSLRFLEDRSTAEIAAELGCSVSAVKTYSARGLSRLRRRLRAAGALVVALAVALGVAAVARHRQAPQPAHTVILTNDGRLGVSVSLSTTTIPSGGSTTATIVVTNPTHHSTSLTFGNNCAVNPGIALLPHGALGTPTAECSATTTPATLAAGAHATWHVTVRAVDNVGAPLEPGRYDVAVTGVDQLADITPIVVTVTPSNDKAAVQPQTSHANAVNARTAIASGPASAPAGGDSRGPAQATNPANPASPPDSVEAPVSPPDQPPAPAPLDLDVSVRTQSASISASRTQFSVKLQVKNTQTEQFRDTFTSDRVTVTLPDGTTYSNIAELLPDSGTAMTIDPNQTFTYTYRGIWGAWPYIDGGVVSSPPALGDYTFSYVFYDSAGHPTNASSFTLKVTS
jgi:RNA polymerase sigma factor (sigma-70 family)